MKFNFFLKKKTRQLGLSNLVPSPFNFFPPPLCKKNKVDGASSTTVEDTSFICLVFYH